MSTPTKVMDAEAVTTEGAMPEVVKEAEEATLEVVEVLAKFTKSPQMPRLNPTSTKESMMDKKGKQVVIPMHASSRRNPSKDKHTTQEKGKAINLESEEE